MVGGGTRDKGWVNSLVVGLPGRVGTGIRGVNVSKLLSFSVYYFLIGSEEDFLSSSPGKLTIHTYIPKVCRSTVENKSNRNLVWELEK